MNKILTFILFAISFATFGQGLEMNSKKVDFEKLGKEIADKKSPYYYDNLMKKYQSETELLSDIEYWYLYYGYSFQSKYIPYQATERVEEFKKITSKKDLDEKDFKKIVTYTEKELKSLPLELDMLWYQHVAWKGLGDSLKSARAIAHFMGIVDAIISSGNGASCETGFSVLYISHEYVILNILGFEYQGNQMLTEEFCDKLYLASNEQQLVALYFDVKRIFEVNLKRVEIK